MPAWNVNPHCFGWLPGCGVGDRSGVLNVGQHVVDPALRPSSSGLAVAFATTIPVVILDRVRTVGLGLGHGCDP